VQIAFWIWLGVVLKVPVAGVCYFVWRVIREDQPEQVIGDGEGGGGAPVEYKPGPRTRGPHEGAKRARRWARRANAGHDGSRQADTERRHEHA